MIWRKWKCRTSWSHEKNASPGENCFQNCSIVETGLVSSNALEIIQPRVVELEISRFNDKRIEMVAGKNTGCVEWETGLERRRRVEVELREFRGVVIPERGGCIGGGPPSEARSWRLFGKKRQRGEILARNLDGCLQLQKLQQETLDNVASNRASHYRIVEIIFRIH